MTQNDYLNLFSPALDWLLQLLSHGGDEKTFITVMKKFKKAKMSLLLNAILTSFKPQYIAKHALLLAGLIRDTEDEHFPRHKVRPPRLTS